MNNFMEIYRREDFTTLNLIFEEILKAKKKKEEIINLPDNLVSVEGVSEFLDSFMNCYQNTYYGTLKSVFDSILITKSYQDKEVKILSCQINQEIIDTFSFLGYEHKEVYKRPNAYSNKHKNPMILHFCFSFQDQDTQEEDTA